LAGTLHYLLDSDPGKDVKSAVPDQDPQLITTAQPRRKTMNKNDLINEIAAAADLTKTAAEQALHGLLEAIETTLAAEGSVSITGFGSFSVAKRAARTGRNPQTGKMIDIAAKKVVKFKPGKNLAEAVE